MNLYVVNSLKVIMERNKQVRVCKIGSLCSVFFWLIFIVIVFLWQKQKREETMSNLFDKATKVSHPQ